MMRPWMYRCLSRRILRRSKMVAFSCFLGFGLSACSGGGEDAEEPVQASAEDDGLEAEIAQGDEGATTPEAELEAADTGAIGTQDTGELEASTEMVEKGDAFSETAASESSDLGTDAPSAIDAELEAGDGSVAPVAMNKSDAADLDLDNASVVTEPTKTAPMAPIASYSNGEGTYIVQPGDSLAGISRKIYGHKDGWQELAKQNKIKSPYVIFPGHALKYSTAAPEAATFATNYEQIPEKTIVVQPGDTLSKLAVQAFGAASGWKIFTVYNNIPNPDRIEVGLSLSFKDPRTMAEHLSTIKDNTVGDETH